MFEKIAQKSMHYLLCRVPNALFSEQICYDGTTYVVPDTEYGTGYGGQGVGGKMQGGQ